MSYDVKLAVQIARVTTLVDGTLRIVLDCYPKQMAQGAILLQYFERGIDGDITFAPDAKKIRDQEAADAINEEDEPLDEPDDYSDVAKPKRVIEIK